MRGLDRRLRNRIADLEQRFAPAPPDAWVRVVQDEGQSREQALAAWEAEYGPIGDRNVIVRVIIGGRPVHQDA